MRERDACRCSSRVPNRDTYQRSLGTELAFEHGKNDRRVVENTLTHVGQCIRGRTCVGRGDQTLVLLTLNLSVLVAIL